MSRRQLDEAVLRRMLDEAKSPSHHVNAELYRQAERGSAPLLPSIGDHDECQLGHMSSYGIASNGQSPAAAMDLFAAQKALEYNRSSLPAPSHDSFLSHGGSSGYPVSHPYPPHMPSLGYYNSTAPSFYHGYNQQGGSWINSAAQQQTFNQDTPPMQQQMQQQPRTQHTYQDNGQQTAIDSNNEDKTIEMERVIFAMKQERELMVHQKNMEMEAMARLIKEAAASATHEAERSRRLQSELARVQTTQPASASPAPDDRVAQLESVIHAMAAQMNQLQTTMMNGQASSNSSGVDECEDEPNKNCNTPPERHSTTAMREYNERRELTRNSKNLIVEEEQLARETDIMLTEIETMAGMNPKRMPSVAYTTSSESDDISLLTDVFHTSPPRADRRAERKEEACKLVAEVEHAKMRLATKKNAENSIKAPPTVSDISPSPPQSKLSAAVSQAAKERATNGRRKIQPSRLSLAVAAKLAASSKQSSGSSPATQRSSRLSMAVAAKAVSMSSLEPSPATQRPRRPSKEAAEAKAPYREPSPDAQRPRRLSMAELAAKQYIEEYM